ncbi:GNAT family N-acetyltransferase [Paractinoplanes atraurantiacus]|uniref:Protein N-acetyltransferase, RimJ/RimL family n=1 Tax=Paractinoplanes atraurantiacus TaxID=1036182 RepID=A0A285IAS5_9ACTN|nr:GNAT family N-acetyltransferase [Actinoplanes atraurantiacus]SNY45079.1 Protein N-acetyltransferase, RimJ/RimL family [Actinoplanes atraurantiacus]
MSVILHGARVLLRPWTLSDTDFVLTLTSDPLIPLISAVPAAPDPDAARAFITAQNKRHTEGRGWAWAVVDDGRPIGYVGALWTAQNAGRASIGYWTGGQARHAGLTTDAVTTAAAWLLTDGGIARLEAYVEPWNTASARVAEKAGFHREGLMKSFAPIGGHRKDAYLYARIS